MQVQPGFTHQRDSTLQLEESVHLPSTALWKKITFKVDGFTFVHFNLKVITSGVKVGYEQEKSSSEGVTF